MTTRTGGDGVLRYASTNYLYYTEIYLRIIYQYMPRTHKARGGTRKDNKKKPKNSKKNNKTRVKRKKNPLKCAPKSSNNQFSCYSNAQLFELKRAWNQSKLPKITTNNPHGIWLFLRDKYKDTCGKESCWLKDANMTEKVKKHIIKHAFAPRAPAEWNNNPNTWLSSTDIVKVMEQYEYAYPHFRFIGPSPIDFDKKLAFNQCVWNDLCNIDIGQLLQNNKSILGMIFNLDPHYKDGSHWVSMLFNLSTGEIYYFDSVGEKIPPQIKRLQKSIEEQSGRLKLKTHFDQLYPTVEHQMRNTECGMYSLYFIIMMLTGEKKWSDFKTTARITDDEMEKFRKVFFNQEL